ncbi:palmitoyl-protein thioesterase 1-like [Dorcoceras hygrometricum]|uniref:Palmitoyl-protein thioesterase 1-like n=1 Tax=Dorcoceras hygrometricum TaxID=472368 RepID=A0A2Z6ZUA1_9LAMI|nr:palmitoyl-protein thioesterase 1-like [Dorcoceras hygrometricum]
MQSNATPTDLDTSRIMQTNATPTDLDTLRIMQTNATPTDLATANATADTSTANATVSNIPTVTDETINSTQGEQGANPIGLDLRWNRNHPPEQVIEYNTQAICFWKFGPQCPTSPLLPPRKAPLEEFDGYSTSANTHPHKHHLYGLLDSTMHTSRNCVTKYIHMSFTSS